MPDDERAEVAVMAPVAVIERDPAVRRRLADALRSVGLAVEEDDVDAVVPRVRDHAVAAVILDEDREGLHALIRCAEARGSRPIPLLAVLPFERPERVVAAVDAGADAVECSRPEPEVVAARVRALLRRVPVGGFLDVDGLRIDRATGRTWSRGGEIHLTSTERRLLAVFAARCGHVVTRRDLSMHVWGTAASPRSRFVDVAVRRLRAKIDPRRVGPARIVAVRGVGYRLDVAASLTARR